MKGTANTDEIFNLWSMLEQVHSGITLARDRELEQHGLSTIKASALFIIDSIGNEATPAEISRWILRRPHSVSGLLDRMEKDGLVIRTKDLPKKNQVRITLTQKGLQASERVLKRASIHKIAACLSDKEQKQLRSYLESLRDSALKELGDESEHPFP